MQHAALLVQRRERVGEPPPRRTSTRAARRAARGAKPPTTSRSDTSCACLLHLDATSSSSATPPRSPPTKLLEEADSNLAATRSADQSGRAPSPRGALLDRETVAVQVDREHLAERLPPTSPSRSSPPIGAPRAKSLAGMARGENPQVVACSPTGPPAQKVTHRRREKDQNFGVAARGRGPPNLLKPLPAKSEGHRRPIRSCHGQRGRWRMRHRLSVAA